MRQRILLLCICIVSYLYSIAQPANNPCSTPQNISTLDGTCFTYDNTGATTDVGPSSCTAGGNNNVWFTFQAIGVSAEIHVTNTIGTPEITLVDFPNTPCNSADFTEISCANGVTLTVDNLLTIGHTYWIMVAFTNNGFGSFDICVNNPVPATNDNCSNATPLSNIDGVCTTFNNNFPSTDLLIPGCFSGSTYNVWFSFVAQGVSLDTHISPGGPGVAQVAVVHFTTPCTFAGSVVLGCATGTNHIVLDNQLIIGQTYYVIVGFQNSSFTAGVGPFDLCVDNPVPAVNDPCSGAITIPPGILNDPTTCYTTISGVPLNNDFPSTDIGVFGCWDSGASSNIWYSFVAQGPDVSILVDPVFNNSDPEIALVHFTGSPCQLAGAQTLSCANGTVLDYNDQLIIGQTYFVAVGFENNSTGSFCMNVFDPVPPPNDLPCNAQVIPTNGNCVDGTTVYANPEGFPYPGSCLNSVENTVWYNISLSDPNNVGFTIDLSLDNGGPNTTVTIAIYQVTNCNTIANNLVFFNCGAPPQAPIEFGPVDETATYYVMIGTSEPNETDFSICVDEIPPCFTNDLCSTATVIPNVTSDMAFVCVPGCNLFADPETFNNNCGIGNFSTVWFQVPTDGNATLMNINVQSPDFDAPTITLFHLITDCSNLQNVGLTQSNLTCITGSNGEAEALGSNVGSNEIYYIAVSSLNSVGGNFTLCVNTISQASSCVSSSEIQITGRSSGGPLVGPFFPGETVSVCMNVNSYTAAGNGCQWFQGMIPLFGNGWDPSSFDANGQPNNATVNGNAIGAAGNGLYGASTWDWFTGIGYHHNNVFFQIGDLDGNGTIEMCNILYDVDCPNLGGITGGCCGPCWANAGDPLPPGWFAYGINGTCPILGPPPTVDWGDGNSCGGGMGPWHFCFDLNVRDYPSCLTDPSTMNLSLGFFTTADGETGAWTGGPSVCALDQPLSLTLPMCCSVLTEENQMLDPICSGQNFAYVVDVPGVDFWTWTYSASGGVTGGVGGQGGPGTLIIATLTNNGSTSGDGEYTFLGFAGGACPVYRIVLDIPVFPKIIATFSPLLLCATPTDPYIIAPDVQGGSGNYDYLWSPGGESTPFISVDNPVNGTTYTVSVSDDVGCFTTATITIQVYKTFPVDILSPVTEQCIQLGPLNLDVNASGPNPPFTYEWTVPGGGTFTTPNITSDLSGQHLVVVTDAEGCIGKDSVTLTLDATPDVSVGAVTGVTAICDGSTTDLSAVGSGGENPFIYDWDTPEGLESGKTITAMTPGTYTVTIEDNNGCTNSADIDILLQPSPVPDLGPDFQLCNFDDIVEITTTDQYSDYSWSAGPQYNGQSSLDIQQAGIYSVTVTNEFGCTGETAINISIFPVTPFPMPDTFKICAGATITINGNDYGGPWDYFIWPLCGACQCCSTFSAGDYSVTAYDDNGCSATHNFTVASTITLSPNLQGPTVICNGSTITLTADPGFTSYNWSVPGSSNSISVSSPGTYMVTVTDNVGCSGADTLIVVSGDFVAAITGPVNICAGIQATLNAGAGFTSYLWSNASTKDTIHTNAGTYTVTVTNSSGCTSVASTTVVQTPFVPQITGVNMICQTAETSTLDAGGPYLNYQWSANAGSATSQTVTVSAAGTYTVTVTDISTCVANASFTVSNFPIPPVAVTGNPDFCVGGNTQLTATNGYQNYAWSSSELTPTITTNTPGNYTVTITDANGCTNEASEVVNQPFQETVAITGSFIFCPGDMATLAVPLGYTSITWSTGQTNVNQIQTPFEGQVSVIVIDPGGCTAYDTVVTQSNSTLYPKITGDSIICDAGPGILDAGPGFDNYQWSGALGTGQTASVSSPGLYSVTVSSLAGCTGEDQIQVVSHASPFAVVTGVASACDVQETGGPTTIVNFKSMVTGGDLTGTWVLVSGPSAVNLANLMAVNFNGLPAGTYTFSYTTNTALAPCTNKSYNMVVTVNTCACPQVQLGIAPDLCNDMGTIGLSSLLGSTQGGGTWTILSAPLGSNPGKIIGANFDASNADPGNYTLQYSVAGLPAYCSSTATLIIKVMDTPNAGNAAAPIQFCAGENQTVTLSTLLIGSDPGGKWTETSQNASTGGAFNDITGKFNVVSQVPGMYTFAYTVLGPGPCPDDQVTVEVEIENNPIADAGATATLNCNQPNTTLGGSGTSVGPEFIYSWTTSGGGVLNNPTLPNPIASGAGTYVLTVMNSITGCSAVDQVVIDQIGTFPTAINLVVKSPNCAGDPPGSAQVMAVTGGVAPYMYSLNNAPAVSSPVFNNLATGHYDIQITDATGCKLSDTFSIAPQVNVDLSIINFVHDSLIFALGDTIKFTYQFSGSSNTPDSLVWKSGDSVMCINCTVLKFAANLSGKVTLEAYDVRGCKIVKSVSYQVVRIRDVYIPDVFSPNGDGINDYFGLFTKADVTEYSMQVFTRWGDLVYSKKGLHPNMKDEGWDGKFRAETLNPGVYVYWIEIVYGDNLKERVAGDITIVR
ncbi:MAG: gliding motility-associated C-terminal domain-containing protein [Saprospiraceae bacterium]